MSNLIIDTRKIKAYEHLHTLGSLSQRDDAFLDKLWEHLMTDPGLFDEFLYYLDHHGFRDGVSCRGYSMTDLYFYCMRHHNVRVDRGKNYPSCNKEGVVLDAFERMAEMKKDPERFVKKLSDQMGLGLDVVE